jgi:hypothetical protein
LLLAVASFLGPLLAASRASVARIDLGPNDSAYVSGFRDDWERDGQTQFRWTSFFSTLNFSVRAAGDGFHLRLRLRRHFVEPAHVRLIVEGKPVASFDVAADPHVPYRTVDVALPPLDGRHRFVLGIEAPSANARALGIALDWVELERTGSGRFALLLATLLRGALCVLAAWAAVKLAGGPAFLAGVAGGFVATATTLGANLDPMALDRILAEGAVPFAATVLLAAILLCWPRARAALGVERRRFGGALVTLLIVALGLRLAILLHPLFYYPDVKVHGLFAWQLARRGIVAFMRDFVVNQYRFSLGLQLQGGHWYAFPYPPGFYLLTWPLVRLGWRPEIAVGLAAAVVNSLELLLVFGIARRLGASQWLALASSAVSAVLPLFLARLSLAYFPAIVGHALDASLILFLLSTLDRLAERRVIIAAAALLSVCLFTYTQSLVNFGLLLALFLGLQIARDREPGFRGRVLGLAVAGALGVLLSVALFYVRYVPIVWDMAHGVGRPEESILLEKMDRARPAEEPAVEEPDPYTGPTLSPWRGVEKASWRLYVFYGLFAPLLVAGLFLGFPSMRANTSRFVIAWAVTYVLLNLASGGLPGPNWLRYNKDLEIVAPLCCLAIASFGRWLWLRSRILAMAYAAWYLTFALGRAISALTSRIVLER